MSLFGSSPDGPASTVPVARPQSKSLFDDEQAPVSTANQSLFADNTENDNNSPWGLPTSKKPARGDLIKKLLATDEVPESYIDAFDTILDSRHRSGSSISLEGVKTVLASSEIGSGEQEGILKLVTSSGNESELGRSEFNVLLALIGLGQEGEEVTLDGVDERRKNLPEPSIPYLQQLKDSKTSDSPEEEMSTQRTGDAPSVDKKPPETPTKSRRLHKDSLADLDSDPWATPTVLKGQTQAVNNEASGKISDITAARPISNGHLGEARTTSTFTTHSEAPDSTNTDTAGTAQSTGISNTAAGGGWEAYDTSGGEFSNGGPSALDGSGFGSGGDESTNPTGRNVRSLGGGGRSTSRGVEETVTITLLPEKEGIFLFQHRNYEVRSARRGSTVVRRYSDFVWLLDCLHKRYPFRQLPLLPPKRVAVNGTHLSADATFVEKRRRGLIRFTNALVRHPVLSQEQLVVMFLTVPTELAVWRKQATISVQEEFTGKSLPPGLEDSLPTNLNDTFETVRAGVKKSAETYIGLCNLLERLSKRNQGVAADYSRFANTLKSLTEESDSTYATDTNDVPLLNEGIKSTAKHLETSRSLLEDEAHAWDEGVLEDFKRQRDSLIGVRDMFERRDRYARDNIPQLERRIESNESKLMAVRAKPENLVKPGEIEKLEQAIMNDKQSIVAQHARGVFIKECIRDELLYFQQSQYHVSKLHQDWSQERVKYAELQADNWRALSEEVENMPIGE